MPRVAQHDEAVPGAPMPDDVRVLPMREGADTEVRLVFQLHERYILSQLRTGLVGDRSAACAGTHPL
ncbi:MAG: hypothetical protein U0U25_03720 [Flavobacteriales bacterium]